MSMGNQLENSQKCVISQNWLGTHKKVISAQNKLVIHYTGGDVGTKQWSLFLCNSVRCAIFLLLKMGTFAKIACFATAKNYSSDAEPKKQKPLFIANIPQYDGLHVCFMRLSLYCGF